MEYKTQLRPTWIPCQQLPFSYGGPRPQSKQNLMETFVCIQYNGTQNNNYLKA